MGRIVYTTSMGRPRDPQEAEWLYNCFDSATTLEIRDTLREYLPERPRASAIYDLHRRALTPALRMSWRGMKIHHGEARRLYGEAEGDRERVLRVFSRLSEAAVGFPVNPASPKQLQQLFYECLGFPPEKVQDKGEWRVSTNRECLERLWEKNRYARPLVAALLKVRDEDKRLQFIRNVIKCGDRFRYGFNVAGTDTIRWSSSASPLGPGANVMNINPAMRAMFVADPGKILVNVDRKTAESFVVAYRSGDPEYIRACESGDLHTRVAGMVWPEIQSRAQADETYYRHLSFRDMSKRLGHLTNYAGTAPTAAAVLRIPIDLATDFQRRYLGAFRGIEKWHAWVSYKIQTEAALTTALGFRREFFGKRDDRAILRKAIAFEPQSIVGHLTTLDLIDIHDRLEPPHGDVELLMQNYDSILLQIPDDAFVDDRIEEIRWMMDRSIEYPSGEMRIPTEVKLGYVWGRLEEAPKRGPKPPPDTSEAEEIVAAVAK